MSFSEDDILLTLKSNTLERNSPSDFITHLKRHYHLPGKWQVGLAEIQIPNSYENIGDGEYFNIHYKGGRIIQAIIPSGRYEDEKDLMAVLNNQVPVIRKKRRIESEELREPERVNERANLQVPRGQLPQGIPVEDEEMTAESVKETEQSAPSIEQKRIFKPSPPETTKTPPASSNLEHRKDEETKHRVSEDEFEAPINGPFILTGPSGESLPSTPPTSARLVAGDSSFLPPSNVISNENTHTIEEKTLVGDLTPSHPENGLQFGFKEVRRRVIVEMDTDIVESVHFSKELADLLGLNATIVKGSAEGVNPVDIFNRHDNIYVSCSLIEPQVVGDDMAPLLRVVPFNTYSRFGELQTTTFTPVWYLRLNQSHIASVRIELRRDSGKPIRFRFGTTVITLHLRRVE